MSSDHQPEPVRRRRRTGWWARRSLRARLTAAAMVVVTIGMVAAAAVLVWRVHGVLVGNLDQTLSRQASGIAEDGSYSDVLSESPGATSGATAVQVIGDRGQVIASSANITGEPRLFTVTGGVGDPVLATVNDPSLAAPYRVAALRSASSSGPVTIYVGAPTTDVTTSVEELGAALVVGVPIVIVLLGLVGWVLLGRALRPVEALRRQAAVIPGTDLHRRLTGPDTGDELGRLAATFNDLLGRIEAGTRRQRQFVADAAHELRTPLAALRTRLEIAGRKHPDEEAGPSNQLLLADVVRLADMVDALLALARLDAGATLQHHPVDLDDLAWAEARTAREQGPPRIDTTGISPARVLGDAQALRRVVANLISNARRHARSVITLRLAVEPDGSVLLCVADDGAGIPPVDRHRVFDRFTRLDEARSRDAGGAGLGLAIVADVIAAHGGQVWIEDNQPGARLCVRLPSPPPP